MAMSSSSWWISTVLFFLLGSFGALMTLKEFGDPEFSDWIRPGPGHALLGDAGRLLMFEAGNPNSIQSLLFGVPQANILEGIVLGLGTIGVLTSPFRNNLCQFITCTLVPVQAWYYLVLCLVYFPLTEGSVEAVVNVLILGTGLQMVSLWRLQSSMFVTAPSTSKLVLNLYLLFALVAMGIAMNMIHRAPRFEAEIQMFIRVREFFMKENNMTWTKGRELPDRFYIPKK